MTAKKTRFPGLRCTLSLAVILGCLILPGCLKSPYPVEEEKPDREGVIGRRTTDIGEFDPSGGATEADLSIDSSRPLHAVTAGAYKNILGRAAQLAITQAVNLFHAEHDRYPRDHEEFMEKIIRYNGIELPVLPGGLQFQYDVENHELKIVEGR